MNYEQLYGLPTEKLFIKVFSFEENRERLKDMPYTLIENLAVTYHILVGIREEGMISLPVNDRLLGGEDIDISLLHAAAVENSRSLFPVYIANIKNMLFRLLDRGNIAVENIAVREVILKALKDEEDCPMFVITNNHFTNGAAAIFYPGVMEEIGEALGNSYFVLPSSVHEVLVLLDNGSYEYGMLRDIVKSVNREIVREDEILTNDIYYYDIDKHSFKTINI